MGIVAGFLVQNTSKYQLQFGQVTNYLGYSALTDFFPTMKLKPNPNCDDANCRLRQKEFASRYCPPEIVIEAKGDEKPIHEENEWGINLVDESGDSIKEETTVAEGVRLAYTLPTDNSIEECEEAAATNDVSLEELMSQMKSM
nr:unnamed protein product [Callosobruchus analis]